MPKLSREALRQMAALCGVYLSDEEMKHIAANVEAVLRSLEGLERLDLGDTEPQVTFLLGQG